MSRRHVLPAIVALALAGALIVWSAPGPAQGPAAAPATAAGPGTPTAADLPPTLPLEQVRIGMKGYGLSVFHGDKIEPFAVEVISVARDFGPQKGVVWIRCPEERMQKTGPVAGMSGSPIYLWGEHEAHTPGQGGKLIGAFAFGFRATRDCYAGVQPIEAMFQVGGRAKADGDKPVPAAAGGHYSALRALAGLCRDLKESDHTAWQARLLAGVLLKDQAGAAPSAELLPGPEGLSGRAAPLSLPLTVGRSETAALLAPLLAPSGLIPLQAPAGMFAGQPPAEIDARALRLRPGSVMSIPLAFGDLDISASGTVTHVTPDGRVLAFGHAMFGEGHIALPMATGYVHYVVPGLLNSFKLGGSAVIQGTLTRDETSAVVGFRGKDLFTWGQTRFTVNAPGQPRRTYQYKLAHHRQLTPALIAGVTTESILAEGRLPVDNTVRVHGRMTFQGRRGVDLDQTIAGANPQAVAMNLTAIVGAMMQNPFEQVNLESLDVTVDIDPVLRGADLLAARLDSDEVAPGGKVGIALSLQPYGGKPRSQRIEFTVPADLPEGNYPLALCDAPTYTRLALQGRPHLQLFRSADDILDLVRLIAGIRSNALYLVLEKPSFGLALGRDEMPSLPSSRRALLTSPSGNVALPLGERVTHTVPLDFEPSGQFTFNLTVKKKG